MTNKNEFTSVRKDYELSTLEEENLPKLPLELFRQWYEDAIKVSVVEPNAFALSTCANNFPSVRIVLLKSIEPLGFTFFTNYHSRKGQDLNLNENCAGNFFWKELERQVRFEGQASKLSDSENDNYFSVRPRDAQISAHASNQSQVILSRERLEEDYKLKQSYFTENEIPRPEHWGGYLIKPNLIEFWQGRVGRLHDRIRYSKSQDEWNKERLAP